MLVARIGEAGNDRGLLIESDALIAGWKVGYALVLYPGEPAGLSALLAMNQQLGMFELKRAVRTGNVWSFPSRGGAFCAVSAAERAIRKMTRKSFIRPDRQRAD